MKDNTATASNEAINEVRNSLLAAADGLKKLFPDTHAAPQRRRVNRTRAVKIVREHVVARGRQGHNTRKLTDEDRANLKVMLSETTVPVSKIALLLGITRAAVYQNRNRENLDSRRRTPAVPASPVPAAQPVGAAA